MSRASLTIILLAILAACTKAPNDSWQGYIEGESMLLASPYAGQLQKLYVHRGDQVKAGEPVFALEQENERAARLEAEARLEATQARLENLKAARRAPEIEAQRAELAQAQAALDLSATQLAQQEKLFKSGFVSQGRLDEARSAYARDVARVKTAEAQLKNLLQPLGREAERKTAEREVEAARAAVNQAIWRLEQKSVIAPAAGVVQDTFFVQGEWVPAGRPVAAVLPPGNVKARFYVAEPDLALFPVGRKVEIGCDGCKTVPATVTFVSPQAEYTPPVIYSRDTRQKLMFLIEAQPTPADGAALRPGQPVDVKLRAPR